MEVKTIYGKFRARFNKNGALVIPPDVLQAAPGDAPLLMREWLVLIFLTADNRPPDLVIPPSVAGDHSTLWRTIKSLKAKGYIPK